MKKFAKLLVLLLTVALIAGAIAIVAGAEENTFDLAAAVEAANDGDTVKLTGNAAVSSDISVTKNLTVDLNGYTITSNTANLFKIDADVTLTVKGTGKILLDGKVASLNSAGANLYVTGSTTRNTIDVLHNGAHGEYVLYASGACNGTISFENVNVETTYAPDSLTGTKYYMLCDGNATLNFNNFKFVCNVKYVGKESDSTKHTSESSIYFLNFKNKTTVTFKNSVLDTTGSGFYISGIQLDNESDVILNVENSTVRTTSKDAITRTFAFNSGYGGNCKGTVIIKDSVVETAFSFVRSGANDNDYIYKVQNSHVGLRAVNNNYYSGQTEFVRGAVVYFDKTSTFDKACEFLSASETKGIYLEEGTRYSDNSHHTNVRAAATMLFPDGTNASSSSTYDIVFDPAGNPSYPYVVVKLVDGALPEGVKDLQAGTTSTVSSKIMSGDFYFFNFSEFYMRVNSSANRTKYMNFDGAYYNEGASVLGSQIREGMFRLGWKDPNNSGNADAGAIEFNNVQGTLNSAYINGNEALKYWVSPTTAGSTETTRDFAVKSSAPYLVIGANRNQVFKAAEQKVVVFDIDIGTDSGEYPKIDDFGISSRAASDNSNATSTTKFTIASDGTLKFGSSQVAKLSTTEWNHLTAVCYTDSNYNAKGKIYYYLDGEFLCDTTMYSNSKCYIQGLRMSITKAVQNIGASICFDNLMIRTYNSYLGENEADESGVLANPNSALYNFYDANADYANRTTYGPASVNGIIYQSVEEALKVAAATGSAVTLRGNAEEKITTPGVIIANGYTVVATEGSLPADVKVDENGNVLSYDFNEKYKGEVTVNWWIGNISDSSDGDFTATTVVPLGNVPTFDFNEDAFNFAEKTIYRQIDWIVDGEEKPIGATPITMEFIEKNGTEVWVVPVIEELEMAQAIVDAQGNCVYATDGTEFALTEVQDGQTIVLYKDCSVTAAVVSPKGNISIDVAGKNLNITGFHPYIGIIDNTTLNVYSSVAGGTITKLGVYYKQSDKSHVVGGNALFYMLAASENDAKTVEFDGNDKAYAPNVAGSTLNAKLNLGTVEGVAGADGKNLTVSGDAVIEPRVGDYSCEVNVKDTTLIKVGDNYGAIIFPRFYNGTINVEGSTLINASDNDSIISSGNSDVTVSGTTYSNLYQSVVTVKDSVLINTSKDKAVSADFKSIGSISYENTIVFGRFCWDADVNKVTIGENVYCSNNDSNFTTSQFVRYNQYIAPEIVKDEGFYKLQSPKLVSNTAGAAVNYDRYLYIVSNGEKAPEGAENVITLDTLLVVSPINKETVTVNFKDLEGNVLKTEVYAKGGTVLAEVQASKVKDVDFVAMKKTFASWPELPENVTENMDILPEYDVVSTVDGIKANISLYSDFDVNLYIPEIYRDFVTVMYGKKTLDKLTTAREGYFKVTVDQLASEAASDVQFVLTVAEAGETFTLNYSVNVANYAKYILEATEGYTEADKTLMEYVVAYANEAYKYANGGKANETLNTLATTYEAVATGKNYTAITNPAEISKVVKVATVILQSAPKFQFTIDKEFVGTVVIGGTEYTYTEASAEDRVVTVEGTRAYNFLDDITIKVGEYEGKYNYSAYAAYHVDNAENGTAESGKEASANALALINALYEYVNYAKTYNANK